MVRQAVASGASAKRGRRGLMGLGVLSSRQIQILLLMRDMRPEKLQSSDGYLVQYRQVRHLARLGLAAVDATPTNRIRGTVWTATITSAGVQRLRQELARRAKEERT